MENRKSFYIGVFAISAIVTAMQILQTRIFSVTTWYHLSFIVISIAMFGLTLGALKIYHGNESDQRRDIRKIAANGAVMCGVCLLLALIVQLRMPLVFSDFRLTLLVLPVVGFITGLPYYFAGITLSVCLTRTSLPMEKVYAVDLVGAASGCLIALGLMESIDTPSGLLVLIAASGAAALFLGAGPGTSSLKATLMVAGTGALLALVNVALPQPPFYPTRVKDGIMPHSAFDYDAWNSISRVTVRKENAGVAPFLWGASPGLPASYRSTYKWLLIDGDAGTVITRFDGHDWQSLKYLDYDVTNLAYHLPDIKRAAIIGVGGGRDLLSAKYFHVADVTAVDVNKIQISLLRDNRLFRSYSNLYNQPGVTLVNSEARSWFRRNSQPFDLIQMSLIDTWASTGAGAFALSENGLYTLEAWSTFFNNLSPAGVFTVSRWYSPELEDETARQVGLATAALLRNGITNPGDHMFMAAAHNVATLIVSRPALTGRNLAILEDQARAKQFKVLVSPALKNTGSIWEHFVAAKNLAELDNYAATLPYDLAPPTDMRPFFFNQIRFDNPLLVISLAFANNFGAFNGHAKATFNLLIMIGFSLAMTILVILLPLWSTARGEKFALVGAGSMYFLLIGLGFMLLEISLLQGFGVFLGHPIYGLSVVLFSLILSTGLGSFLSGRLPLRSGRSYAAWCLMILAYTFLLSRHLGQAFDAFGTVSLPGRAAVCVSILAPLGLLLGYGFPSGMRISSMISSRATAWFYGINGAAGVLGSALGIAFNIGAGIDKTILVAGFCYALLLPFALQLCRMANRTRDAGVANNQ